MNLEKYFSKRLWLLLLHLPFLSQKGGDQGEDDSRSCTSAARLQDVVQSCCRTGVLLVAGSLAGQEHSTPEMVRQGSSGACLLSLGL